MDGKNLVLADSKNIKNKEPIHIGTADYILQTSDEISASEDKSGAGGDDDIDTSDVSFPPDDAENFAFKRTDSTKKLDSDDKSDKSDKKEKKEKKEHHHHKPELKKTESQASMGSKSSENTNSDIKKDDKSDKSDNKEKKEKKEHHHKDKKEGSQSDLKKSASQASMGSKSSETTNLDIVKPENKRSSVRLNSTPIVDEKLKDKKEETKDHKEEHANKRASQIFTGVLHLGTKSGDDKEKKEKKRKERKRN